MVISVTSIDLGQIEVVDPASATLPSSDIGAWVGVVEYPGREPGSEGGDLLAAQRKVWQKEGLPARCPVCRRHWKFLWSPQLGLGASWVCPMFDAQCWVYIRLSDVRGVPDGGYFRCRCDDGEFGHLCDDDQPGSLPLEFCVRTSAERVRERQRNVHSG